eukprot:570407-Amphidinium_carterae.1
MSQSRERRTGQGHGVCRLDMQGKHWLRALKFSGTKDCYIASLSVRPAGGLMLAGQAAMTKPAAAQQSAPAGGVYILPHATNVTTPRNRCCVFCGLSTLV